MKVKSFSRARFLVTPLFAMAEELGFRAVEIRAISNYVGEEFAHWMVYDALSALAEELVCLYE